MPWQRNLGLVLLFVLAALAFGYLYERAGERREARHSPAPGRMVQVGDHRLHLLCKGDAGPTLVIEQGAGELARFWWPVQAKVAEFARVCTYDRAGFAWSDPVRGARTVEDRAKDLHTLLGNAGVPAPYIFVAHSYGGLVVRSYLGAHAEEVAGLVLVDTPEEASLFQPDVLDFYAKARVLNRVAAAAVRFGILRLLRNWVPLDRYGFWLSKPAEYDALCDDLASLEKVPTSMRVSQPVGSLGALPVVVITHGLRFPGPFAVLETNWTEGQRRLASLSSDSMLIVAEKSNHMIQHDEPDVVIAAIRRIHEAVSRGARMCEIAG
jgi:pimeloyl-ACP methyl ester carboxylesterase